MQKSHNIKNINIRMKYGHFFYFFRRIVRFKKLKKRYVKQYKKERKLVQKINKKKFNKKEKINKLYGIIKKDTGKNKKKGKINKRLNDKVNIKKKKKTDNKTESNNLLNNEKTKKVIKIIGKNKKKKKNDKSFTQKKLENINHYKKKKIIKKKHKIKVGNKENKAEISIFKENNQVIHIEKIKNDCNYNTSINEKSHDILNEIFRIQYSTNPFKNNSMLNYANKNNAIEKSDNKNNITELYYNKNNVKELHDNDSKLIQKFYSKNKTTDNNFSKEMFKYFVSRCIDLKNYIVKYNSSFKNIFNNLFNEYMFLKKYINSNHNAYHKLTFFFSCKHYLKKFNYFLSMFYDVIKENDEDLMVDLYKEVKINRRLLYYIGRILSNYLTCIAYKKMVYIIIICISRVHTVLNCLLISEPFKSIIPELLDIINHIKI
ncbi:conserved Plasmodium protein, unknown function [Plasmodium relictum]|uniref:Uncharacterized protein n=1 Tax=Plasmodium relictum TaxID=85471 RepID=A0A1J1H1A7_PLARL|nr:conserved Plasmodium protein, unknown function [Plasmodium relictum]CRG98557.1 conserved Plasmodium protein, unknown function [Plasmodium relictum]